MKKALRVSRAFEYASSVILLSGVLLLWGCSPGSTEPLTEQLGEPDRGPSPSNEGDAYTNGWTQWGSLSLIAHRGFACCYPENTLEAIEGAIAMGAQAVEVDVRFTADGVAVLMHDATVDRTTDGSGRLLDFTFANLASLDACPGYGRPCVVPTVDAAIRHARGRARLVLDMKEVPSAEQFRPVLNAIRSEPIGAVAIISGDMRTLKGARSAVDSVPLGYYPFLVSKPAADTINALTETIAIGHAELLLGMSDVVGKTSIFRGAVEMGVPVTAWTARTSQELQTLLQVNGVRRVLSDVPPQSGVARRQLDERRQGYVTSGRPGDSAW